MVDKYAVTATNYGVLISLGITSMIAALGLGAEAIWIAHLEASFPIGFGVGLIFGMGFTCLISGLSARRFR